MKFYQKSLIYKNTILYDIDFPQKIGILRFFLRKFLLTVLHIISSKILLIFIVQIFKKSKFSIYPNILDIQKYNIVRHWFSSKNWNFAIFFKKVSIDGFSHFSWKIFWLFFLLSKVSKMKFYKKSLIYKNTTLYDIDFPQKIGILRFFLRKFLLTVFQIIYGFYIINFYCPKFQKWNFIKNPWYTKIQHCTTLIFLKKLEFCDFF